MSQDFAEKSSRRLSKFSNAGDDRFRKPAEPVMADLPPTSSAEEAAAQRLEALAGMVENLMAEPERLPMTEPQGLPERPRPQFSRFAAEERQIYAPPPPPTASTRFDESPTSFDAPYDAPGDTIEPLWADQQHIHRPDAFARDMETPRRAAPPPAYPRRSSYEEHAEIHNDGETAEDPRLYAELERLKRPHQPTPPPAPAVAARETETADIAVDTRPGRRPRKEKRIKTPRKPRVSGASAMQSLRRLLPGRASTARIANGFKSASKLGRTGGFAAARLAKTAARGAPALLRVARAKKLSARYRMALAALHTRLLDRRIERLLFVRTERVSAEPAEAVADKDYRFDGPIPRVVFNWALGALPDDLKTFAFVDLRAGNGRTMLLAARRNFEVIHGYAFSAQGYDDLELNIAQYPRSLMSCRNLRAIRGDVEGVTIPEQPCVLFIPNSGRERHLSIILSHVASSFRLNPRPIYLIFDNADRDTLPEQDDIFEPVPLPLPYRIRLALFSPARIRMFRSVLVRTAAV